MDVTKEKKEVIWDFPEDQQTIYLETLAQSEAKPLYSAAKRVFDVIVSFFALAVLLMPMLIISLVIVIDSPGKPIYAQVRLGKNEKPFTLYKFRSMCRNAEQDGLCWAGSGDRRVTKVGRFLRSSRIDELPQLWNILKGEMSFVGPRPERPEFYELFDTYIVGFRQRMMVTPGLTGLAQVNGGYELKPEEKIIFDLEYIKNRSVGMDLKCIIKTVMVVLGHKGAR